MNFGSIRIYSVGDRLGFLEDSAFGIREEMEHGRQ